jgi:hypothetical protein
MCMGLSSNKFTGVIPNMSNFINLTTMYVIFVLLTTIFISSNLHVISAFALLLAGREFLG